jgi:ATP-grasp domain
VAVRRWLAGLGVPVPASQPVPATFLKYQCLAAQLGTPFVLQQHVGSAGVGTYLIADAGDIERIRQKRPAVPVWLASRYAGDITLNLHGLVTATGRVVISQPSLQLANQPLAGTGFGEYCGSDFAAPALLPSSLPAACRAIAERIGTGLADLDYRGLFGVDLALQDDAVFVLEVNGRVQASSWLLGELELEGGGLPLLVRHVLELLGQATAGDPQDAPAAGAQLVIRHTGGRGHIAAAPTAGRYRCEDGRLHWQGTGIGLTDCGPADVMVLGVPRPGVIVEPGAALGRLVTRLPLAGTDGRSLSPIAARLITAFRSMIRVKPYTPALAAGTVRHG